MSRPASPELQAQAWSQLWTILLRPPDLADPVDRETGGNAADSHPRTLPPAGEESFGYGNQASPG